MGLRVSIVIVNWNGMAFLPSCLKSIADNPPSDAYDVWVVDNVSNDGSREWLAEGSAGTIFAGGNLRVILSDVNLGFGRANNLAISSSNHELIFVLNPDTIIKPGAIDRLIEVLVADKSIGAVSPKLLNADGTLQTSVAGFPPNPFTIIMQGLGLTRLLPRRLRESYFYGDEWAHDELKAVPVFWGTAILAKREMIDQVGAFDPDFFMYGEDVEWCVRINRRGWKTVFVPDAEVIHLGGKSSAQAWKATETTLRKDAADILVQQKTLPILHRTANAITKSAIYSLAYLRRFVLGQKREFLIRHIGLQLKAVKSVFSNRPM